MRIYLIAIALYGAEWHEGQWSDWYRRQCTARHYLEQWYGITGDLYVMFDYDLNRKERCQIYKHHRRFREVR